jgi:hypothetical protein
VTWDNRCRYRVFFLVRVNSGTEKYLADLSQTPTFRYGLRRNAEALSGAQAFAVATQENFQCGR